MTALSDTVRDGVLVEAAGESAFRVVGVSGDAERDWRTVHHLARRLAAASVAGLSGSIPTYESVLVEFDPMTVQSDAVRAVIEAELETVDPSEPLRESPREFRVPVVYGGETGPDLDEVAGLTGLTADEIIAIHSGREYVVRCLGAPGGSPMLDGPELPVQVPRLASPRPHVPQGAVSLAGRQATITPAAAPGGWRVIGWTPLVLVDLSDPRLVPYEPGDLLRFDPIDAARAEELRGRPLRPVGEEGR